MPAVKLSQIVQNQTDIAALVSGSTPAAKATKLNTARSINGLSFDGSANINHYATCTTAAATVAKVATLSGYSLQTGGRAMIKFTYENTAAAPTLNINSTGAKAIKAFGTTESTVQWVAGDVVEVIYDGTNYIMLPTMGMIKTLDDAVDTLSTNLNAPTVGQFIYDYQNGKAGYNTSLARGADTFHPFKSDLVIKKIGARSTYVNSSSVGTITIDCADFSKLKIGAMTRDGSCNYWTWVITGYIGTTPTALYSSTTALTNAEYDISSFDSINLMVYIKGTDVSTYGGAYFENVIFSV